MKKRTLLTGLAIIGASVASYNFGQKILMKALFERADENNSLDVLRGLLRKPHRADEIILFSRKDAEYVLTCLRDIVDDYDYASVSDLEDLLGMPESFRHTNIGWTDLRSATILRCRKGWKLYLPPAKSLY
jgi:hypothetical protein